MSSNTVTIAQDVYTVTESGTDVSVTITPTTYDVSIASGINMDGTTLQITVADTAPADPSLNDLWFDTS